MKAEAFYQNLGKLFFAVAMADQSVKVAEIVTLKNMVKEKWLDLDDAEDDFGTDAAFQIEIVFDWLTDQYIDSEACFNDFAEYKKQHESRFTPAVKKLIWETAESIAEAFAGKNKSELTILGKLKSLLA